eukprot:SAG31_NODE_7062_length_1799_cov_2.388824_2_plen_189_part_00
MPAHLRTSERCALAGNTEHLNVNPDVKNIVESVASHEKEDKLVELLSGLDSEAAVIIFANKKTDCEYIASGLNTAGIWAESIHGDKDQWQRQQSLANFKASKAKCIVATDVAARGLDIKGVSHVINYDFPMPSKAGLGATEDWVHRVGRTGRAGLKGIAYTFFDPVRMVKSLRATSSATEGCFCIARV